MSNNVNNYIIMHFIVQVNCFFINNVNLLKKQINIRAQVIQYTYETS
jgi:hypothetical protein